MKRPNLSRYCEKACYEVWGVQVGGIIEEALNKHKTLSFTASPLLWLKGQVFPHHE